MALRAFFVELKRYTGGGRRRRRRRKRRRFRRRRRREFNQSELNSRPKEPQFTNSNKDYIYNQMRVLLTVIVLHCSGLRRPARPRSRNEIASVPPRPTSSAHCGARFRVVFRPTRPKDQKDIDFITNLEIASSRSFLYWSSSSSTSTE